MLIFPIPVQRKNWQSTKQKRGVRMNTKYQLFINGNWGEAVSGETFSLLILELESECRIIRGLKYS